MARITVRYPVSTLESNVVRRARYILVLALASAGFAASACSSNTSAAGQGGGGRGNRGRGSDGGPAPVVTTKVTEKDVPVDIAAIGN